MNEHPEGMPVSLSTYATHGCRCDGCRAARLADPRDKLNRRARTIAVNKVIQWVMRDHYDLWLEHLSAARAEVEKEHPEWVVPDGRRKGAR